MCGAPCLQWTIKAGYLGGSVVAAVRTCTSWYCNVSCHACCRSLTYTVYLHLFSSLSSNRQPHYIDILCYQDRVSLIPMSVASSPRQWPHTHVSGLIPMSVASYPGKWPHPHVSGLIPMSVASYPCQWPHIQVSGLISRSVAWVYTTQQAGQMKPQPLSRSLI